MKTLRQFCVALVFAFSLTVPALAGDIETGIAPPPPSQPQTAKTNGEISTGLTGQDKTGSSEATATGSATNAALNLIQSVLSLF